MIKTYGYIEKGPVRTINSAVSVTFKIKVK